MVTRDTQYGILTTELQTIFFFRDKNQPDVLFMSKIYHWDEVVASLVFAWFALAIGKLDIKESPDKFLCVPEVSEWTHTQESRIDRTHPGIQLEVHTPKSVKSFCISPAMKALKMVGRI